MHLAVASIGLDSWLGIIGLALSVVSLVVGYIFYRRQKRAKTLDFTILSSQSLTTDEAYPGLTIGATWVNSKIRARVDELIRRRADLVTAIKIAASHGQRDRDLERLERLQAEADTEGPKASPIKLETRDPQSADQKHWHGEHQEG